MAGDTLYEDFIPPGIARVREPVWLRDGSRFYFLAANASDQVAGIWSVDPRTGVARQHVGPAEESHRPARYVEARQKIVDAAIRIIVDEGAASLSYGRVARAANMVRSGPLYYF